MKRVKRNYGLIFVQDRVGRLADAQQYERLELPRDRFSPAVLETLRRDASHVASVEGGNLVIEHLYTERRVRPLDLYLAEVDRTEARRVTLDFGQAIKDLAAADIFPGDMLVKNFGVTRHGRVIFYDYDEVAPSRRVGSAASPKPPTPKPSWRPRPTSTWGPTTSSPKSGGRFSGRRATSAPSSTPPTPSSSTPTGGATCRSDSGPGRSWISSPTTTGDDWGEAS